MYSMKMNFLSCFYVKSPKPMLDLCQVMIIIKEQYFYTLFIFIRIVLVILLPELTTDQDVTVMPSSTRKIIELMLNAKRYNYMLNVDMKNGLHNFRVAIYHMTCSKLFN